MADWTIWINLGVPMTILVAIGVAVWKVGKMIGHRLIGQDDNDPGLLGLWVKGEMAWRTTLTERLENQQVLCGAHAGELKALGNILEEQQIVSLAAQKGVAESNVHLARLVDIHEKPGQTIHQATVEITATNGDVIKLKQVALRACEMCRAVARVECPGSADLVNGHCDEIERIIGEA